ncbi:MAG: tyrosine--tRNA ligase [Firmicutes bacterium]|nr:tyrosine--tRNA ligase [Bacillota bacterium]
MAVIRRGAAEIVSEQELERKIARSIESGRPLRVKYGADPSAPDIHLGHTVCIRKMKQFQDLGHEIVFIIGDFTGMIGDPSGRSEARKQLSEDEIALNAKTYQSQVFKILEPSKTRVVFNSSWLGRLSFADVIHLAAKYTVARMLERDEFQKRFREEKPISVHEFLYPLAQAYDSVAIEADLELGGTDQTFNFLLARDIQREYGQEPQVALTMPLLPGTDGVQKMSKSLGNYIGIDEPPAEMYGKTMSIPDHLIVPYLELVTAVPANEVRDISRGLEEGTVHPRDAKMRLAREIVSLYHGAYAADEAERSFVRVFRMRMKPEEMPEVVLRAADLDEGKIQPYRLVHAAGFAASASAAKRLVDQGAVYVDDRRVSAGDLVTPRTGTVIRVGKRGFGRIRLE